MPTSPLHTLCRHPETAPTIILPGPPWNHPNTQTSFPYSAMEPDPHRNDPSPMYPSAGCTVSISLVPPPHCLLRGCASPTPEPASTVDLLGSTPEPAPQRNSAPSPWFHQRASSTQKQVISVSRWIPQAGNGAGYHGESWSLAPDQQRLLSLRYRNHRALQVVPLQVEEAVPPFYPTRDRVRSHWLRQALRRLKSMGAASSRVKKVGATSFLPSHRLDQQETLCKSVGAVS